MFFLQKLVTNQSIRRNEIDSPFNIVISLLRVGLLEKYLVMGMISRACLEVIFLQDFITIFTLSLSSVGLSLVVFDSLVVVIDVCISLIGIDLDVDFALSFSLSV